MDGGCFLFIAAGQPAYGNVISIKGGESTHVWKGWLDPMAMRGSPRL